MIWPQITLLVLYILGIWIAAEKHGKPSGTYNVKTTIASVLLVATILYFGGFWKPLIGG